MKKLLLVSVAMLSLAASNVFAAERTINGGSKENTYVEGQKDGSPVETKAPPKEGRHFGDGSQENSYVEGQKDGSPVETKAPPKEGRHFGDGSVENKQ
ncbi:MULTISPECIES: hypothetical protein [unclassified Bartonella]|uniref:hypothetical protein n=1 Tax=unclassified Bartonella TaxID=2645622 RepID=UPI0015F90474|nr:MULTISPECIES: hypothetical protein [unclassified Bartonella]UXN02459.1 hypothetical protein N6B01_08160 [Bartonella sp. HY406]